jgi:hypothetical protein
MDERPHFIKALLSLVGRNFNPPEVFDRDKLERWAKAQGYIHKDDIEQPKRYKATEDTHPFSGRPTGWYWVRFRNWASCDPNKGRTVCGYWDGLKVQLSLGFGAWAPKKFHYDIRVASKPPDLSTSDQPAD